MIYFFVGLAGVMGAVCRYLLGIWIGNHTVSVFPFSTLTINVVGCFILSFFYTVTTARFRVHTHVRTAFGTGFVGAFTTFSTFSYETLTLMQNGHVWSAICYVAASLIGGYGSAYLGIKLGGYERDKIGQESEKR